MAQAKTKETLGRSDKPRPHEIDGLESYLAARKPSTGAAYRHIFGLWIEFLKSDMGRGRTVENAEESDAYRYLAHVRALPGRDGKQCPATVRNKINVTSHLYDVLVRRGVVKENPFRILVTEMSERVDDTHYGAQLIPFDDAKRLLDAPSPHTKQGVIDRAMLALLLGSGLRAREMTGIKLKDIKRTTGGTWYIELPTTKSNRKQDQALQDWVASRVLDAAEQRKVQDGAAPGEVLICHYIGGEDRPLYYHAARRAFLNYCRQIGASDYTLHSCRATAITKLLADGISHRDVKSFSRHASVQMVERYDKARLSLDNAIAKKLDY